MRGGPTLNAYAEIASGSLPRERYPAAALSGVLTYIGWARRAIAKGDVPAAHQSLVAAQQIVAVLRGSLEHNVDPDMAGRLDGIYAYIQEQLIRANVEKSEALLAAVGPVVASLRETWESAAERVLAGAG